MAVAFLFGGVAGRSQALSRLSRKMYLQHTFYLYVVYIDRHGPRRGRSRTSAYSGTDAEGGTEAEGDMSDEDDNVSVRSHSIASSFISRHKKSPRLFQKERSVQTEPGGEAEAEAEASWWRNRYVCIIVVCVVQCFLPGRGSKCATRVLLQGSDVLHPPRFIPHGSDLLHPPRVNRRERPSPPPTGFHRRGATSSPHPPEFPQIWSYGCEALL